MQHIFQKLIQNVHLVLETTAAFPPEAFALVTADCAGTLLRPGDSAAPQGSWALSSRDAPHKVVDK